MEICTSHYTENLGWLEKSPWPVTVVSHSKEPIANSSAFHKVYRIPNEGYEATSYLAFIMKRYDSLPDHTVFLHGHETADHQKGDRPLLDMIRDAQVNTFGFIHLNNGWVYKLTDDPDGYVDIPKYTELIGDIPRVILTTIGAQFIVSKERILQRPLEWYKKLFKACKTKKDATSLEHLWHIIFGEPAVIDAFQPFFDPPVTPFVIPSEIVPEPHKLTLYTTEDVSEYMKYPLAYIKIRDDAPTDDFNAVHITVVDGGFVFRQKENTLPFKILTEFFIDVYQQSIRECTTKDNWVAYHRPLFERFFPMGHMMGVIEEHRILDGPGGDVVMIGSECDILMALILARRNANVVILDEWRTSPLVQKAFTLFREWYEPVIRTIMIDEVLIFINLRPEPQFENINPPSPD